MKSIALATIALAIISAGCGQPSVSNPASPGVSPARLTIRTTPDPEACPGAALPTPFRFKIDPLAEGQVLAIGQRPYRVWWAPGFVGGDVTDPVVRDPNGAVVARDGELVEGPLLHGYTICATGDSIIILLV
jgi:hypothetical protein